MSLSPCSSDLGADIISTLGALTCADENNFFIQTYDGTKSELIYINVATNGTVSEQWRAGIQNATVSPFLRPYYQALEVGETYLYAQDPEINTKWYVLDKSDGSVVASRDFAGIELGNWKQVSPVTEQRTATGLSVVGNYCYFSSWWWEDKNNTGNNDLAQRGAFIVNFDDLTDYSSAPVTDSIGCYYNNTSQNESIEGFIDYEGRSSSAYELTGPNYRLAITAHTRIASSSPLRNNFRPRIVILDINDPFGTPSLTYNGIIRNTVNTRWNWAPVVAGDGGLLSVNSQGGAIDKFALGTFNEINYTSLQTQFGGVIATESDLSGWSSIRPPAGSADYDISIANAAVDQGKQHFRGPPTGQRLSVKDNNDRAYDFKYGSAIRYNDQSDLNDSTSLDLSVINNITRTASGIGFTAANVAGSGLHAASVSLW